MSSAWTGINLDTTFEARADTVVEMCRRGYAESMVLSQDASCYIDWVDPGVMAMLTQWRYTHIHEEVLPYLREHGVTDGQIEKARVFAEAARLLRPGGRLALADIVTDLQFPVGYHLQRDALGRLHRRRGSA